MFLYNYPVLMCTTVLFYWVNGMEVNQENSTSLNDKVLSRKRRYLVFPEGSSFQIVYCLTVPAFAAAGGIFTIGLTASLAWELPHEAVNPFRKQPDPMNRRQDIKKQTSTVTPMLNNKKTDYSYKSVTYYKKPIVKPSYYKPVNYFGTYSQNEQKINDFGLTSGYQPREPVVNYYFDRNPYEYHALHRRTRRDLYLKLEKFFTAQRKDGRACLLKALCEISQASKTEKGTFVEALMRTIFTWNPDPDTTDHHYQAFNKASTHLENCNQLYPTCTSSVLNIFE